MTVWYDHLPFKPFPRLAYFTPKDKMADWLESYARDLNINIRTTQTLSANYQMEAGKWLTTIEQNNEVIILQPHILLWL